MNTNTIFARGAGLGTFAMLALLAGCGDAAADPTAAAGGAASLSVSFAATGPALKTNAAGNAVLVGTSNDTMVITKVQLVLDKVKLRNAGVVACPDSMAPSSQRGKSSQDRGCSRMDLGPMLLDLPLTGPATSLLGVTVPAGTYRSFEFEVDDINTTSRATQAEKDFLVAHPEFRNATVRVTGTYKGVAFTFVSRAQAEVEFEFNPSLEVKAGVNDNVSVTLDLGAWFKQPSGALFAPTVANQLSIDQNIINSFSAFGDGDRDGQEDSGRGGKNRGRGTGKDD
jgi:hypothetical protein